MLSLFMHLIFDTETTGLPTNWKAPVSDTDNWPRMIQLAYQLYDDSQRLIKEVDHIIKPEGFVIPKEASDIHGITTQQALEQGILLSDAIEEFFSDLRQATHVIAHNADFDTKIIDAERVRLDMSPVLTTQTTCICTMKQSTPICKIPGPYGYKWPRLEQLHRYLFEEDFSGAHNALYDVQATAKCYFKLREQHLL